MDTKTQDNQIVLALSSRSSCYLRWERIAAYKFRNAL